MHVAYISVIFKLLAVIECYSILGNSVTCRNIVEAYVSSHHLLQIRRLFVAIYGTNNENESNNDGNKDRNIRYMKYNHYTQIQYYIQTYYKVGC